MRECTTRRGFLLTALGAGAASHLAPLHAQMGAAGSASLTEEQRDRLTPDQIIDELKKGNERFRAGKTVAHDYRNQQRTTAAGQYPAAALLGCVDSRVPAEILFDSGI